MKGFKNFLMQGNLVELAVAFVIGTAFAKLVDSFVTAIVKPLLNAFSSSKGSAEGLGFRIKSGQANTFIDISALINSVIVFVLTAAVIYFLLVLPYKKVQQMRGIDTEGDGRTELDVLKEIQEQLRTRG